MLPINLQLRVPSGHVFSGFFLHIYVLFLLPHVCSCVLSISCLLSTWSRVLLRS